MNVRLFEHDIHRMWGDRRGHWSAFRPQALVPWLGGGRYLARDVCGPWGVGCPLVESEWMFAKDENELGDVASMRGDAVRLPFVVIVYNGSSARTSTRTPPKRRRASVRLCTISAVTLSKRTFNSQPKHPPRNLVDSVLSFIYPPSFLPPPP